MAVVGVRCASRLILASSILWLLAAATGRAEHWKQIGIVDNKYPLEVDLDSIRKEPGGGRSIMVAGRDGQLRFYYDCRGNGSVGSPSPMQHVLATSYFSHVEEIACGFDAWWAAHHDAMSE
jgi:hypothetical protein